jgi:serine protease Do
MSRNKKAAAFAGLIGLGFTLGILFTSQVDLDVRWRGAPAQIAAADTKAEAQQAIREASRLFTDVAKEVTPSVVTISSSKVFRPSATQRRYQPREDEPMPDNPFDFFHRFFDEGGPGEGREFRQQGLGSGVIVSRDGYIITNNHVVAEADEIQVGFEDGRHVPAKLIGTDPKTDIAVVQVAEKDLPAGTGIATLGDSDHLEVGEWVLAIGSPFSENLSHSVTAGIVSAVGRSYVGLTDYEDYIQTDAAINPGNSGGALVDMDGNVVGINTAIATRSGGSQGVGFAIPINMARNIMESLVRDGKVVRGWLGVLIQNVTDEIAEARKLKVNEGVIVGDITKASPAEKAGLERGDVITAIDGTAIRNTAQLRNMVARTRPGTRVDLTIIRDGRTKQVALTLGELPEEGVEPAAAVEKSVEELGIEVTAITPELAERYELEREKGAVVTGVESGSLADRYDIREGDVVLEVNSESISSIREYKRALEGIGKNKTVLFLMERAGATHYVAFKVPK